MVMWRRIRCCGVDRRLEWRDELVLLSFEFSSVRWKWGGESGREVGVCFCC